ncbi:MAG: MopE-related protein, partial [Myxococcota bacterium]
DFYQLQLATSGDFTTGSIVHDVVTSDASVEHALSSGVLSNATTYFWRVRGSNAGGMGAWSSTWTFHTQAATSPPDAPLLSSPLHGAANVDLTPQLAWLGNAGAFRVQLALDPGFAARLLDTAVATKTLPVGAGVLAHTTTYYWRVRGENAVGAGPWSSVSGFTTLSPPLPPTPPSNLRSPAQGATSIDLIWDASADPRTTAYRVYRDGVPIASESEASHQAVGLNPSQLYHFEVTALDSAGRESLRTAEIGVLTRFEPVSLSFTVRAGRDDAEERISSGGSVNLTSADLELTEDASRLQAVGIRFRNVDVPQGTTIRGARIQFTVDEKGSATTSLTIEGEASDDAAAFSSSDYDVTSRPRTSHSVAWDPPPWTSTGAAGPNQRTPELTTLVQEIVDRPGWSPGNAMAVVISGSGHRTAEAYDGSSSRAAVLEVDYDEACPADADGDGFDCAADCDDGDADVHPGAAELCDGRDNDCDYSVDEGDAVDAVLWSADFDGDGYGDPNHRASACAEPPGWVTDASDCDDANASAFPGAGEICDDGLDNDCDGATDSSDELDCVPILLSVAVAAGKDDAEERISSGGSVSLGSADLELTEDQGLPQAVGIRFRTVGVPRNATIRGARIQFTVDETGSAETILTIEGEASDDAAAFRSSDYDVTSRPRTSHSVAWDPPPWTSTGAAGPDQRTPELTEVVQEIVDRPGWSSGNAMAVVISGSGHRTAEAYDGDRKKAARLEVEYLCEVDADGDGFACQVDCDDGDPSIHPGAAELCDGRDNDCDADIDEGDAINAAIWFADFDGDGYGDPTRTANACAQPPGWVADASDCDDLHDSVHPGAWDVCDGLDNDCDGTSIDEDFQPQSTSCGIGVCGATGVLECIAGTLVDSCQPGTPASADATCNALDDDCDGSADEDYLAPATQCGVGACGASGALECIAGALVDSCEAGVPAANDAVCNGLDDDCDGGVDEEFVSQGTECGVGACGASGSTSCVAGALIDSCEPGAPAPTD